MRKRFNGQFKKFLSGKASSTSKSKSQLDMDVRDEYANAFRTESYNEFWARVIALSDRSSTNCKPVDSTTAARLSSYRLFAEHLLDPDQPTATGILASACHKPAYHALLSEYFSETANASLKYSHLLKEIEHARVKYKALKANLQTIATAQNGTLNQYPAVQAQLTKFSNSLNPFLSSVFSPSQVGSTKAKCSNLLKRLESSRDKVRAKLRIVNNVKHGSACFLVALTASLVVIVVAHSVALLVATPGLVMVTIKLAQTKKLASLSKQLDAAAKGTYILNRDLDTISRIVARLDDEVEHMHDMVKFWLERGADRLHPDGEVARLLRNNECRFTEQLDELEEHLYLCFMTVNRARNLVVKEILGSEQSTAQVQRNYVG